MEDKERTLYCGNLSEKVTEDILYELFLQAGPLENITIPKDKDGRARNFAFIAFKHTESVPYAVALMTGISLYGKVLRLDARSESNEPNPYLQKLQNYSMSRGPPRNSQGYHSQTDNRYRGENCYPNSRNEFRMDNFHNSPPIHPQYSHMQPQYSHMQLQYSHLVLPPPVNNYDVAPNRHDYRSPRSGYRR